MNEWSASNVSKPPLPSPGDLALIWEPVYSIIKQPADMAGPFREADLWRGLLWSAAPRRPKWNQIKFNLATKQLVPNPQGEGYEDFLFKLSNFFSSIIFTNVFAEMFCVFVFIKVGSEDKDDPFHKWMNIWYLWA